jgi:hypothetical protein
MTMRFLSVYRNNRKGVPPSPKMMAKMGALMAELQTAGVLLSAEGCQPSVTRVSWPYFGPFPSSSQNHVWPYRILTLWTF